MPTYCLSSRSPAPFSGVPARLSARSLWPRLAALGLVAALAACGQGEGAKNAQGGGARQMPQPEVGVETVQPGEVGLLTELPGRLEASRVAQVRARAAGILQQRLFQEGSEVKAGQALFRIDPSPSEAALQTAEAQLARAEANLSQARALAGRYQPLVEAQAVSQQDYANAVAAQKQAEADVAAGKAAVRNARINLGYATVTSPIAGRVGRALVTEGALVGQGEATQLAVVQQVDPLYVNFTQSASEALRLRRALEAGQLKAAGKGAAEVRVVLDDGSEHPQAGKLLFTDLTVDSATGQVSVRVRLEQARASNAITLPQQAVMRSAQGDAVQVVTPEGKIEQRRIQVGGQQGGRWVVLDGLKAGEQVMVDGFQKVQMLPPGTPVKAVPWQPAGAAPAAAPAASAASGAASPASR